MFIFTHATLLTPWQTIPDGALLIQAGRIAALGETGSFTIPTQARIIDAGGLILAPGYIDLQINGAFGKDFTETPDCLYQVAADLPQYGVTSFLPTIITSPLQRVQEALELWQEAPPPGWRGALPLGCHLEGPMINPGKKGAHPAAHILPPAQEVIQGWSAERGVRLVTLAPELPQALEIIQELRRRGITLSAGHTLASYAQAVQAFAAGVTCGTHLFNAMPTLEHRNPGIAGALLQESLVSTGLIADGVHVHPAMVALAWKAKQPHGLALVSDAMAALSMPPGQYRLGGFEVIVDASSARLADGTLAGSLLSMDAAVRNLVVFSGCSLGEAIACASANPAKVLDLAHKGILAPGMDADLVLLDGNGQVQATWVGGQAVFSRTPLVMEPE